jgi:pseudaminic acid cytidylyltransferase
LGTPPQRGLKINNGKIIMIDKKNYKTRTQDLNKIYHDAGQFCWGKTDS